MIEPLPGDYADLVVNLSETQIGRFTFGVGVNSDLGLTAQVIIDERHFDWRRYPLASTTFSTGRLGEGADMLYELKRFPEAKFNLFRGPVYGVHFNLVNFTEPYLWDTICGTHSAWVGRIHFPHYHRRHAQRGLIC